MIFAGHLHCALYIQRFVHKYKIQREGSNNQGSIWVIQSSGTLKSHANIATTLPNVRTLLVDNTVHTRKFFLTFFFLLKWIRKLPWKKKILAEKLVYQVFFFFCKWQQKISPAKKLLRVEIIRGWNVFLRFKVSLLSKVNGPCPSFRLSPIDSKSWCRSIGMNTSLICTNNVLLNGFASTLTLQARQTAILKWVILVPRQILVT